LDGDREHGQAVTGQDIETSVSICPTITPVIVTTEATGGKRQILLTFFMCMKESCRSYMTQLRQSMQLAQVYQG
jgi:hypothetical protein